MAASAWKTERLQTIARESMHRAPAAANTERLDQIPVFNVGNVLFVSLNREE